MKYQFEVPDEMGLPEKEYLYVDDSGITGAGKGLFTRVDIFRGEKISVYKGEIILRKEFDRRTRSGNDQYFINLPDGRTLDCKNTVGFGKYANDRNGNLNNKIMNNSVISLDDHDRPCIAAIRHIKGGSEIFVSYGSAYWKKRGEG